MKELLSILNFDARTKEGITNITVWLSMLVYFLFINFFVVPVDVSGEKPQYIFYLFVLFVPAAVRLIFFSGDAIAFDTNREAKFFQAQFPDEYIATKYSIGKPLARHLWFRALDKRLDEGEVQRVYAYGYTCRLVYYLRRMVRGFAILSIAILLLEGASSYWKESHAWHGFSPLLSAFLRIQNINGKSFYLLHLILIFFYLRLANRPDANHPTGVWRHWKDINDRNKAWIDGFKTVDALKEFAEPAYPSPPPRLKQVTIGGRSEGQ